MVVLDIRMGGMLIPYLPQPKVQVMSVERKEKKKPGRKRVGDVSGAEWEN